MGFTAACIVQAVQTPYFWPVDKPVPVWFFLSHFLVLVVIQVSAALLLGGRLQDRLWAGAVLLIPIAFALIPQAYLIVGTRAPGGVGAALAVAALLGAWGLWVRFAPAAPGPLVAAALGAVLGAEVHRFFDQSYAGAKTEPMALMLLGLVGIATLGASLFAGRLPLPRLGSAAALLLGLVLLAADAGLAPIELRPPGPPPSVAESTRDHPSVVLIVLDTVRADRLKAYGHDRDTMPNLERFGREHGVRVERAIANAPWTLSTHASLFTGLHPPRHGAHHPYADDPDPPLTFYPLGPEPATLAALLSDAGYWTVGLAANAGSLQPPYGLARGFQLYRAHVDTVYLMKRLTPWRMAGRQLWPLRALDGLPPFSHVEFFGPGSLTRTARDMTNEAIAVLERAGEQPFFLFINYFDAHTPYDPPQGFRDPSLSPPSKRLVGSQRELVREVLSRERSLTPDEASYLAELYDGELRYLDTHLARLFDALSRHPQWEDTLVIVTSDHGEAFGEHDLIEHPGGLYEELIRVPLFIKSGTRTPNAPPPGSTLGGIVESVDIFPLVLEHAHVRVPDGIDGIAWGRGRSYGRAWQYKDQGFAAIDPERFDNELRAIQGDGWKLIESSSRGVELYDLGSDPSEAVNRAEQATDRRAALLSAMGPREAEPRQLPPASAEVTAEMLEQLHAIGYVR
jgi:arylsulfatase A-like enzyme